MLLLEHRIPLGMSPSRVKIRGGDYFLTIYRDFPHWRSYLFHRFYPEYFRVVMLVNLCANAADGHSNAQSPVYIWKTGLALFYGILAVWAFT